MTLPILIIAFIAAALFLIWCVRTYRREVINPVNDEIKKGQEEEEALRTKARQAFDEYSEIPTAYRYKGGVLN